MAIEFNANTEFVNVTQNASINDAVFDDIMHVFILETPAVFPDGRILNKRGASADFADSIVDSSGVPGYFAARSGGTSTDLLSSTTLNVSTHNILAFGETLGSAPRMYLGEYPTEVAEVSYTTQTAGATAFDNNEDLEIGSRGGINTAGCNISAYWMYDHLLSLAEVRLHQWMPYYFKLAGCILHHVYWDTGHLIDLSGTANHGTLNGTPATVPSSPYVPWIVPHAGFAPNIPFHKVSPVHVPVRRYL